MGTYLFIGALLAVAVYAAIHGCTTHKPQEKAEAGAACVACFILICVLLRYT